MRQDDASKQFKQAEQEKKPSRNGSGQQHTGQLLIPGKEPDFQVPIFRGVEVRVHWWYKPDSYDEFIPAATAPADPEPDQPNPGAPHPQNRVIDASQCFLDTT